MRKQGVLLILVIATILIIGLCQILATNMNTNTNNTTDNNTTNITLEKNNTTENISTSNTKSSNTKSSTTSKTSKQSSNIREEDQITSDGWDPKKHEVSREYLGDGESRVTYDDGYHRVVDQNGNILSYGF